ncbi:hypothetical protein HPB48_024051 [Haemaphysalis longicornis]|uniref:Elongation of very long chain fatty acids protein n=1 Tax=Haemaphysalis longicornis TaxID=44386 RepID=A0A9J6H8G2_HAELO|nr:hypothetical protein HPB48_024051 [Haemaphysalis longicornis]
MDSFLFEEIRELLTGLFPGNRQLIALLLFGYLYVVKIGGPRFMKNRKPYDGIKPLIAVYNLAMVMCSAWFVWAVLSRTYLGGRYGVLCQGIDFQTKDDNTMAILSLIWWYTMFSIGCKVAVKTGRPSVAGNHAFVANRCRRRQWRAFFSPARSTDCSLGFLREQELIALLLLGYLYVVKIAGPRFMKNRKPYEGIKPLIAMYNLAMVLLSAWFASAILSRTYVGGGYSILCQGIDFDAKDEKTMTLLSLLWWYYMVRIGDFLDTVFFILRKKDSHVSFLHVVHHALVVFNGWFGLTYGPDGHALVPVIVNACVHVFMYSYYFLSLLGPSVRKYLWWKRYLTQLQLVQFVILFIHAWLPLFFTCGYPSYEKTAAIYLSDDFSHQLGSPTKVVVGFRIRWQHKQFGKFADVREETLLLGQVYKFKLFCTSIVRMQKFD